MNTINMRDEPLVYELSRAGRTGCFSPDRMSPNTLFPGTLSEGNSIFPSSTNSLS